MDILDDLMDLAEAYVGPNVDELYRRLMERDNVQDEIEVVMLTGALTNILGHDNRGDHPTAVLLMAAWGLQGVLDSSSLRFMRPRNVALSGSDLAEGSGLGTARTYQPGEMPLPTRTRPGLQSRHQAFRQEMSSEAASSSSHLKAAVPPTRARVEEEVPRNVEGRFRKKCDVVPPQQLLQKQRNDCRPSNLL